MNKEIDQKISQFLDDELNPAEISDFLLKIKQQPALLNKISRYQLAAQVLKSDQYVLTKPDFLAGIQSELKQEPHYLLPQQKDVKKHNRFWQKTSMAVAASLACVAVIMSQQGKLASVEQPQQIASVQPQQITAAPVVVAEVKKPAISQHERLKAYLQAHNDDLYTHGSLNVHSLAVVASYGQD